MSDSSSAPDLRHPSDLGVRPRVTSTTLWIVLLGGVILFSLVLGALNLVRTKGAGASAHILSRELADSVAKFEAAYHRAPTVATLGHGFAADSTDGVLLLTILLGTEPPGPAMQNPRKTAFLTRTSSGLRYPPHGGAIPLSFDDPYGNPFQIILVPGATTVPDPLKPGASVSGHHALVYSLGPDGLPGTHDEISSW